MILIDKAPRCHISLLIRRPGGTAARFIKLTLPCLRSPHPYIFLHIFATTLNSMDCFRGISLPSEGSVPAIAVTTRPHTFATIECAFKAFSENKTLTAGIILGLAIIFAIGYTTSPFRKLPPGPRRLPILGNALQLRDKSWLLSKDCKERFGEFTDYVHGGMIWRVHGRCRRGYVSRRCWTTHRCV